MLLNIIISHLLWYNKHDIHQTCVCFGFMHRKIYDNSQSDVNVGSVLFLHLKKEEEFRQKFENEYQYFTCVIITEQEDEWSELCTRCFLLGWTKQRKELRYSWTKKHWYWRFDSVDVVILCSLFLHLTLRHVDQIDLHLLQFYRVCTLWKSGQEGNIFFMIRI